MKILNNYRSLLAGFMGGLVLMGIGCGVGFFEIQSIDFCGQKEISAEEFKPHTVEAQLPKSDNILIYSHNRGFSVEADESLDKNTAVLYTKAPDNCDITFNFETPQYIYNTESGHISKDKYSALNAGVGYNYSGEEFAIFKTFMYDIKQRKMYDYTVPQIEMTIKVAPENVDRFIYMEDSYGFLGSSLPFVPRENEEIYYDDDNGEFYALTEHGRELIYSPYEERYEETVCEEIEGDI